MSDTPEMRPVNSSNIHSVGYDPAARALFVRFKRWEKTGVPSPGALYRYADVPPDVYAKLVDADESIIASKALNVRPETSVNRTFDSHVRGTPGHPLFPFEKIEG